MSRAVARVGRDRRARRQNSLSFRAVRGISEIEIDKNAEIPRTARNDNFAHRGSVQTEKLKRG